MTERNNNGEYNLSGTFGDVTRRMLMVNNITAEEEENSLRSSQEQVKLRNCHVPEINIKTRKVPSATCSIAKQTSIAKECIARFKKQQTCKTSAKLVKSRRNPCAHNRAMPCANKQQADNNVLSLGAQHKNALRVGASAHTNNSLSSGAQHKNALRVGASAHTITEDNSLSFGASENSPLEVTHECTHMSDTSDYLLDLDTFDTTLGQSSLQVSMDNMDTSIKDELFSEPEQFSTVIQQNVVKHEVIETPTNMGQISVDENVGQHFKAELSSQKDEQFDKLEQVKAGVSSQKDEHVDKLGQVKAGVSSQKDEQVGKLEHLVKAGLLSQKAANESLSAMSQMHTQEDQTQKCDTSTHQPAMVHQDLHFDNSIIPSYELDLIPNNLHFNGDIETYQEFKEEFMNYTVNEQWDEPTAIKILFRIAEGGAKKLLLKSGLDHNMPLSAYWAILDTAYIPKGDEFTKLAKFKARVKLPSESCQTFLMDLKILLLDTYPTMVGTKMYEDALRAQFLAGLPTELQDKLHRPNIDSLEYMCELIDGHARFMAAVNSVHNKPGSKESEATSALRSENTTGNDTSISETDDDIIMVFADKSEKHRKKLKVSRDRFRFGRRRGKPQYIKLAERKAELHDSLEKIIAQKNANDCKPSETTEQDTESDTKSTDSPKSSKKKENKKKYPTCGYCSRKGHSIKNCFKKQMKDQKKFYEEKLAQIAGNAHGAQAPANLVSLKHRNMN